MSTTKKKCTDEEFTVNDLSPLALRVYHTLLTEGEMWESDLRKRLFPEPKYVSDEQIKNGEATIEEQRAYWQYDVNINTSERTVKVGGQGEWEKFIPTEEMGYDRQTSRAYLELYRLGLAGERNNGYNCYRYYITDDSYKNLVLSEPQYTAHIGLK